MDLVRPWLDAAASVLPRGTAVWDAHTHTGDQDRDGVSGSADRLIEKLVETGHAGAVVTTNQNPAGYATANDRILSEAQASEGMLIPFLRVDPNRGPEAVADVVRCLDAGHRGIKLHPRAEDFRLADAKVDPILRVAAERGVPVLVHAGRGIASLGLDAVDCCEMIDGLNLILAHAGVCDLSWLGRRAAEIPGMYFDTSWWDIADLLALFAWVPPGRILHASDTPYSHPALSLVLTLRAAVALGYGAEQLRALCGGTLQSLLNGSGGTDVGPAPGTGAVRIDPALLRLHAHLHRAVIRALAREDATEAVALARLGCVVPDSDEHAAVYGAIDGTLQHIDPAATRGIARPLIIVAAASLTPAAPLP